eukprot:gnl/TRDRNA2_/TRDRNA2_132815_c1_seq1.p1 gnl/TRDRNA2_/TRDRNA2_132815_c1~~gnl/TRDRNA2_/TRDRNA2_132815_c1_seq1.p1  ORF type:complete len:769 (+),score=92.06 gnl/TRDRNA2_/TRDRNA2_132815_c1_seq1:204-2309(+)
MARSAAWQVEREALAKSAESVRAHLTSGAAVVVSSERRLHLLARLLCAWSNAVSQERIRAMRGQVAKLEIQSLARVCLNEVLEHATGREASRNLRLISTSAVLCPSESREVCALVSLTFDYWQEEVERRRAAAKINTQTRQLLRAHAASRSLAYISPNRRKLAHVQLLWRQLVLSKQSARSFSCVFERRYTRCLQTAVLTAWFRQVAVSKVAVGCRTNCRELMGGVATRCQRPPLRGALGWWAQAVLLARERRWMTRSIAFARGSCHDLASLATILSAWLLVCALRRLEISSDDKRHELFCRVGSGVDRVNGRSLLCRALAAWLNGCLASLWTSDTEQFRVQMAQMTAFTAGLQQSWQCRAASTMSKAKSHLLLAAMLSAWLHWRAEIKWCGRLDVAAKREHVRGMRHAVGVAVAMDCRAIGWLASAAFGCWLSWLQLTAVRQQAANSLSVAHAVAFLQDALTEWQIFTRMEQARRENCELAAMLAQAGAQVARAGAEELLAGRAAKGARRSAQHAASQLAVLQRRLSSARAFDAWRSGAALSRHRDLQERTATVRLRVSGAREQMVERIEDLKAGVLARAVLVLWQQTLKPVCAPAVDHSVKGLVEPPDNRLGWRLRVQSLANNKAIEQEHRHQEEAVLAAWRLEVARKRAAPPPYAAAAELDGAESPEQGVPAHTPALARRQAQRYAAVGASRLILCTR